MNQVKKKKRFFSKASKTRKKAEHKNGIIFSKEHLLEWDSFNFQYICILLRFALNNKYTVLCLSVGQSLFYILSLCLLCILLSDLCSLHLVFILPLVCSLQSTVQWLTTHYRLNFHHPLGPIPIHTTQNDVFVTWEW